MSKNTEKSVDIKQYPETFKDLTETYPRATGIFQIIYDVSVSFCIKYINCANKKIFFQCIIDLNTIEDIVQRAFKSDLRLRLDFKDKGFFQERQLLHKCIVKLGSSAFYRQKYWKTVQENVDIFIENP